MRVPTPSRFLLLGLFLFLLLLVLTASAFFTYSQVRATIEEELGERLLAVASATAAGITPETLGAVGRAPDGVAAAALRELLARVVFDTGVGDLYLFDRDRRHLLDAAGRFDAGFENPNVELHYAAATAALAGVPAASELYRVGDVYLKTAFAPVFAADGSVRAVVAAEGGASFFAGLWRVRRQMLASGALGIVAVLALTLFFSRLLRAQAVAERTLRETSALAAAGELAAVLAHEIRNPLAIISSRAERVRAKLEQDRPREEILEWFTVIPREIDRLDQTLSQYLAYARPAELQGEADLVATLQAVLGLLANDFTRKGIAVATELPSAPLAPAAVAPAALHQVLVNLLLNARDAMPDGGRLTCAVQASGGAQLRLAIADTGVGMTAEQRRRAFEPFYTTKAHGSGLGLAVVRSMLDLYGARLEVESEPGKGTRFRIHLPVAARGTRRTEGA